MKLNNMTKLENARAAIYTRVSTTEQTDGTSLEDQEVLCLECARRHNMTVVKIFKEDKTAMKPNKRPMFDEMMKMVENGDIDAIICAYADRLSRNDLESGKVMHYIEKYDIALLLAVDNLIMQNPISPNDFLVFKMQMVFSTYRVLLDRERCRAGIKAKSLSGFRCTKAPYGYVNAPHKDMAVAKKNEAEFVQKAFELFATEKYSVVELSEELFAQGYRYRLQESGKIPKQSLLSMLKNPFYTGYYTVKQTGDFVRGNHSAIINDDVFEKVQEILKTKPKAPRKHNLLFSRLLTCDACGHYLVGDVKEKKNGKRYVYYRCTNPNCESGYAVTETLLFDKVISYFSQIHLNLIPKEIVKKVVKEELKDEVQKLSKLKKAVSYKSAAKVRFDDYIMVNNIEDEDFIKAGYAKIENEYANLDVEIAQQEQRLKMLKEKISHTLDLPLSAVFESCKAETKRQIIELTTNLFKMTAKGLKITFYSAFRKIRQR